MVRRAVDRLVDSYVAPSPDAPFAFLLTDDPLLPTPGGYAPAALAPAFPKALPMGRREKFAWFLALVATCDLAVLGITWLVMS